MPIPIALAIPSPSREENKTAVAPRVCFALAGTGDKASSIWSFFIVFYVGNNWTLTQKPCPVLRTTP